MNYLNPFDYIGAFINIVRNVFGDIVYYTVRIWIPIAQLLMLWTILMLVMPGVNFIEHITWLLNSVLVEPAYWMFYLFNDNAEYVRVTYLLGETNPILTFSFLLLWFGLIGLSLICVPVFWFGWICCTYVGFIAGMSEEMRSNWLLGTTASNYSPTLENLQHLFMGRTTIQDTYDAEVLANEIGRINKNVNN